ncbi:MAG TPA: hypothetical protein VLX92_25650 [Kofleriaceae bacterium]|nr:hypothetical protein [Kofleriaceae bacterium]
MGIDRREFVAGAAAVGLAACSHGGTAGEPEPVAPPAEPGVVRVASVKTAVDGGLLPALTGRFERGSPLRVRVTTGERVYDLARRGDADLVISHYGHKDAEGFVLAGLGEWPRTIFSNQMALLGPPADPAGVRGLDDACVALSRIAATRSKLVVNDLDGVRYLSSILWHGAGRPDRAGWWLDAGASKDAAIELASRLGAYVLWGLTPFLELGRTTPLALEPLVLADPLLQRMLVSVVVKPAGSRRVNRDGAAAFEQFLLAPETQAAIRATRYPGKTAVNWVPAGRNNRTAILPKG